MDWQEPLITSYLYVCKHYREGLRANCQRMSNYADLSLTDQKVITRYRFRIIEGRIEITTIDKYTAPH